jgi:hypothetical protein
MRGQFPRRMAASPPGTVACRRQLACDLRRLRRMTRRSWVVGGAGGAAPLAEGGGRLRVVSGGACCSVMALLLPRAGPAPRRSGPGPGQPRLAAAFRRCSGVCLRLRLKPETSNLFLETRVAFLMGELGFLTSLARVMRTRADA